MRQGWIAETVLAEMLGVSDARIKELRPDLERGEDWDLENGRIIYSASGVEQVTVFLGISESPAAIDGRMPHEPGTLEHGLQEVPDTPAASQAPPTAEKPPPPIDESDLAPKAPVALLLASNPPAEKRPPELKVWVIGVAGNKRFLRCGPTVKGAPVHGQTMYVRMARRKPKHPARGAILTVTVAKDGILEWGGTL
jgi:hypothetical protein